VTEDALLSPGDRLIVAFSGGVDSSVLLHLLRFSPALAGLEIHAAHFDHAMRPDSRVDMLWARGLCRAWGVIFHTERAQTPPSSEADAREMRYDFILRQKEREEASWVMTAHQADDQAETVLFRVCRGTGLRGLAGIPRDRFPGVYRPLLPFSRIEILEYAQRMKVPYLEDPTNQDLQNPRNRLRHEIIPRLEAGPAPRIREALGRLARLARENEAAWESLLPYLLEGVLKEEAGSAFVVRSGFLTYHPAVQARLLREVLGGHGVELDEAGTRVLLEFAGAAESGRSVNLPGGGSLVREYDRLIFKGSAGGVSDESLAIPGPGNGSGRISLGGREFRLGWGMGFGEGFQEFLEAPIAALEFPLTVRGWEAGDRIQFGFGTQKLKKVFSEAKVPLSERRRIPVVCDAEGRVIWAAGYATSSLLQDPTRSGDLFFLGIREINA
jgi:tRNA(Ile)-lysidine synthase